MFDFEMAFHNSNLTEKDLLWILDNLFGQIFIADSSGKILYANRESAEMLKVPRERLLEMNVYDLLKEGITDHSITLDAIKQKKKVTSMLHTKYGEEFLQHALPFFDDRGNVRLVLTYSQVRSVIDEMLIEAKKTQDLYKETINYLTGLKHDKNIVVSSPVMKKVYKMATRISQGDSSVMLYGESGTGKDVLANYIHANSPRSSSPFIPVNCAAIPKELVESEFFGYAKGAFTGASKDGKVGLFELANGGTLFLDEIGEFPLHLQAKLLRVLETGDFTSLGSTKQKHTDFRLIAATNKNLLELVNEHKFRADLYYRLNVIPITIPPLRERPEDIADLAQSFLDKFNKKSHQNKRFSPEVIEVFLEYAWPGNIRELKNLIERMLVTTESDILRPEDTYLIGQIPNNEENKAYGTFRIKNSKSQQISALYASAEKEAVLDALLQTKGNKLQAAKLLGISRGKLYKLLESL